jgi:hypothetical protein
MMPEEKNFANGKTPKYVQYVPPKPSWVMQQLWRAAGADKQILEMATYGDQIKYLCLGGIILSTGAMAGLAGGYAFYTVFSKRGSALDPNAFDLTTTLLSVVFGVVWGLIIFNIDRFIVTSTGKGDGTEGITWQEFKGAIPRIIMGSVIALTISKPVEIRMFKTEIDVELHKEQMIKQKEYLANIDSIYAGRIAAERQKIEKWESEIQKMTNRAVELEDEYIEEARLIAVGPRARAVKEQWDRSKVEEQFTKDKYEPLIAESYANLKKFETQKQKEIDVAELVANGLDGLLERIKLAHHIAGFWISLFITLLFLVIELTPIFFKLMLIKTPYDYLEDNIKEIIKAEAGVYVEPNYYKDKEGMERDLVRFLYAQKILDDQKLVLQKESELSAAALNAYSDQMRKKIEEDPNQFVRTDPNFS